MSNILNSDQIHLDERGVAWIGDSNIKVIEVILDHVQALSPEQIHAEYPHLSLAQIHAAIAYYGEHTQEIDTLMQQWQEHYKTEYAKPESQALRQKIRSRISQKRLTTQEEVAA